MISSLLCAAMAPEKNHMTTTITKKHTYEEIRNTVIDVLVAERPTRQLNVYPDLVGSVTDLLIIRGAPTQQNIMSGSGSNLMNDHDIELVRDVFWDLFRQGIVILGRNDMNQTWPAFRLSYNARETLARKSAYRFHDANSYLNLVKTEAPDISPIAEEYLAEAIATYYVERLLSACVMLGVAAEVEFIRLIDTGVANPAHTAIFQPIEKEPTMRRKILKFQAALPLLPKPLLLKSGEDLDTHINTIQSVLRVARNKAGHALANRTPIREQVYVYLQMFVPFAGHLSRLRNAL